MIPPISADCSKPLSECRRHNIGPRGCRAHPASNSYRGDFDSKCDGQEFANSGRQPRLARRYGRNAVIRRKSSNFTDHRCQIQFRRAARCSRSPRSRSIWHGRCRNQLSKLPGHPRREWLGSTSCMQNLLKVDACLVPPSEKNRPRTS